MDIPDPSDWKPTNAPAMAELESLLYCHVCKDFLKAPVLTSCSHTFCSLCIRRHLSSEPLCPICREHQLEAQLRKNTVLEDIVLSFQRLRPDLLALAAKKSPPDRSDDMEIQSDLSTDGQDVLYEQTVQRQEKEALEDSTVAVAAEEESLAENEHTEERLIVLSDRSESDEDPNDPTYGDTHIAKKRKTKSLTPNKTASTFAPCPICRKMFPISELETTHIDECLSGTAVSSSSSSRSSAASGRHTTQATLIPQQPKNKIKTKPTYKYVPSSKSSIKEQPKKKLAKINFNLLKDYKLKEKLSSLGLPTTGSRTLLERRYSEWTSLWNANLDAKNPVSERQLRRNLAAWEEAFKSSLEESKDKKEIDSEAWAQNFSSDFKDLVSKARQGLQKAKPSDSPALREDNKDSGTSENPVEAPEDSTEQTEESHASPGKNPDAAHPLEILSSAETV